MTFRLLAVAAALALVAVACGGSGGADGVVSLDDTDTLPAEESPSSGDQASTEAAFLDLTQCLRDEGLDVEDPQVDADGNVDLTRTFQSAEGFDQADIEAAIEACSEFLDAVVPTFTDIDFTELQDDLLAFAQCMRDNGFDMPDPDFSNLAVPGGDGAPSGGPFGEIDPEDPAFEQAFQNCEDTLPGFTAPAGGAGNGG